MLLFWSKCPFPSLILADLTKATEAQRDQTVLNIVTSLTVLLFSFIDLSHSLSSEFFNESCFFFVSSAVITAFITEIKLINFVYIELYSPGCIKTNIIQTW